MLNIPLKFDDLLKVVDTLSPEQKRLLRQHLADNWSTQLGKALDDIQADVPSGLSDEKVQTDIENAIEDVRLVQTQRILGLHMGAMWTRDDFDDPLEFK